MVFLHITATIHSLFASLLLSLRDIPRQRQKSDLHLVYYSPHHVYVLE